MSRSIALTAAVLAALVSLSVPAATSGAASAPDVRWSCPQEDPDHCAVEAVGSDGSVRLIYEGPLRSPAVLWHGEEIAEFRTSCGSPCSTSWFVDFSGSRTSRPFQDVIAVDAKERRIAVAAGTQIEVWRMFGAEKPDRVVRRDFAPVAALVAAVRSARFEPGVLRLSYLGAGYEEREESISLR
jgi:hypothetical protein